MNSNESDSSETDGNQRCFPTVVHRSLPPSPIPPLLPRDRRTGSRSFPAIPPPSPQIRRQLQDSAARWAGSGGKSWIAGKNRKNRGMRNGGGGWAIPPGDRRIRKKRNFSFDNCQPLFLKSGIFPQYDTDRCSLMILMGNSMIDHSSRELSIP
jgi:hypothetical protein